MLLEHSGHQTTLNDKIKPNLAKMLEVLQILDELPEAAAYVSAVYLNKCSTAS
jgi:hypothetical protein